MSYYTLDPLSDSRWDDLVARHPSASVFHQRGWLEALRRTYGYKPFVLTSAEPGQPLKDGIALCRVSSWITGTRLVSLPFADHCEPLMGANGDSAKFMGWLRANCKESRCKYVEIRPLSPPKPVGEEMGPSHSYCLHVLDIKLPEKHLFERLHKDSVQRKIRRAEREHLSYEAGRSEKLQREFYRLLLLTRRRHLLPPQPRTWFKNLVECMGDRALIRIARKDNSPVAALLTLQHGTSVVYKYGCSNGRLHNLGGMALLFWKLIQESKASGAETIDFGRSDLDNAGLITFKDNWGTTRKELTYYRYPACKLKPALSSLESRRVRHFFTLLPDALFSAAGRILYRHMG